MATLFTKVLVLVQSSEKNTDSSKVEDLNYNCDLPFLELIMTSSA